MQEALIDFCAAKVGSIASTADISGGYQVIETIFRALDLVPTPILVGMNPASTDIRSNLAGLAVFGASNSNLSQTAAPVDRPNFQVYCNDLLVAPDDLPMQRAGLSGLPVESPECELRFDDGSVKCIRGRAVPVFGRDGSVCGTIGVFLDVTEQRETERRVALLQEEVKHRAKNTLSLVLSVARLTLKPKLEASDYDSFEARLQVIGRSVDVFMTNDGPPQTVMEVVRQTVEKQIGTGRSRVSIVGPDVSVPLQSLASLGMALHELTTNACKYGALSVATGSVDIVWKSIDELNVLAIDWVERGGPKVVPPLKRGFGSRLLDRVLGSPAGKRTEVTYNELGVECRLYVGLC